VGLIPVVMGLFGIAEVLSNLEESVNLDVFQKKIRGLLPTRQDWKDSGPAHRPGDSSWASSCESSGGRSGYSLLSFPTAWRRSSPGIREIRQGRPSKEWRGPEAANNSATAGGFVPLFILGIPPTPVMALILGRLMIHNLQPGPMLLTTASPSILGDRPQHVYREWSCSWCLNLP